jgi:predicted transcriptional regulator
MAKKGILIRLESAVIEQMNALAEQQDRPVSRLYREAIQDYLKKNPSQLTRTNTKQSARGKVQAPGT